MVDEQKLRQLAEAATPGPWVTGNTDPLLFGSPRNPGTEPIGFVYGPSFAERSELGRKALSTSEYIATANPAAILSLLDRVKALEEGLQVCAAELQAFDDGSFAAWKSRALLENKS